MSQNILKKISPYIGYSIITIVLLFTIGFFAGKWYTTHQFSLSDQASAFSSAPQLDENDLSLFWQTWNALENKFPFDAPDAQQKLYGAIAGMVDSYQDPYTTFFPPQESALFYENVRGSFGGVGMEVGRKDGLITVIAPMKDSPAERAGIMAGDIIVSIDDTEITNRTSIDSAVSLIRGKPGTTVVLGIYRESARDIQKISVVRENISIPVLETRIIDKKIFVIELYNFNDKATDLFYKALQEFNASGLKNLVIDVRNNPGGYLESAIDIASFFVPEGKIIVQEDFGNQGSEKTLYRSKGFAKMSDTVSIAVLVNQGSASASEILVGALQEHAIAHIIGAQTFGKGSVQELVPLPDGSSVKITVAKWLTPLGKSISDGGLTPDTLVVIPEQEITKEVYDKIWEDAIRNYFKNNR